MAIPLHDLIQEIAQKRRVSGKLDGSDVEASIKNYRSLIELLPTANIAAIHSGEQEDVANFTTHAQLSDFISHEFDLQQFGIDQYSRVGVAVPNGPELVACLLACVNFCTCAPINPSSTQDEIEFELRNVRAKAVIILASGNWDHIRTAASNLKIMVLELWPRAIQCGLFDLHLPGDDNHGIAAPEIEFSDAVGTTVVSSMDRPALILHTSGTTGTKKIVPILLSNLCIGAICVAASIELCHQDVGLNMMPLFHVGGIVRNVFAPLFAGGSVVCTSGFDPMAFWELCATKGCTWYYAAPTMHMMILDVHRQLKDTPHKIRMIANAAGGLLPSVAEELKNVFGAAILPSYGMTECMPIACPPVDYRLERPGCSGMVVGPELRISGGTSGNQNIWVGPEEVGNIMLKGPPLMVGYENNPAANAESFTDGWFNTGDMGYLDKDGYLYITGRSKEVINRGGEIISPFDIEDALNLHPSIKCSSAFSAPHDKLQEVVGVVVVMHPEKPRLSLRQLQRFVSSHLQPAKWPQVVVYMDDVVKTLTGKIQRIGLAKRFDMMELTDGMPELQCIYEADSPPKGSDVNSLIPKRNVEIDLSIVESAILLNPQVLHAVVVMKPQIIAYCVSKQAASVMASSAADESLASEILAHLQESIHGYMVPEVVMLLKELPLDSSGGIDFGKLPEPATKKQCIAPRNPIESQIKQLVEQILPTKNEELCITDDFFMIGGDSMSAGRLVSQLRSTFGVPLFTTAVFTHRTVEQLSQLIQDLLFSKKNPVHDQPLKSKGETPEWQNKYRPVWQMHIHVLLWQLIPLIGLYPVRRVLSWMIFVHFFALFSRLVFLDLLTLIAALICTKIVMLVILPVVFIFCKWIIIGRYRPGRHRIWSFYYLRWWLVEQMRTVFGRGVFKYSNWSLILFYRLLGMHLGYDVIIDPMTAIAEYDLLTFENGVRIDKRCTVRAFCVDHGTILLKPVRLGSGVSVCSKSIVAPGHTLENDVAIGPMSSSYDMQAMGVQNKKYCRTSHEQPHWIMLFFFGYPIFWLIKIVAFIPILAILHSMVYYPFHNIKSIDNWQGVIIWFAVWQRVGIYLLLRPVYKIVVPLVHLTCTVLLKRLVLGKFVATAGPKTQMDLLRYWLISKLLPRGNFAGVAAIVGTHYQGVSLLFRLLGSKVGKRIYWPGSGIDLVEYDLFEVGDDVVFGSRSSVICSTADGYKPVKIGPGANIADRCFLLPGVVVEDRAVLGTGTLGAEDFVFPKGSTWMGSQGGQAVHLENRNTETLSERTLSPFGRAFYERKANYFVIPLFIHIIFNTIWIGFVAIYNAIPIVGTVVFVANVLSWEEYHRFTFFGIFLGCFIPINTILCLVALAVDIIGKWILLGRRKPGEYNWDQSSYCQRWQLYLLVQRISRSGLYNKGILHYFLGSPYLVWYFRLLGCNIGKNVCLYPTGGDPMMTEPDLVTIGDETVVDNASVIAHINSRGNFKLNRLTLHDHVTLRTHSRLISGAEMETGSSLLEHTLIMGGDKLPPYTTWQGWPATQVFENLDPHSPVVKETNEKTRLLP